MAGPLCILYLACAIIYSICDLASGNKAVDIKWHVLGPFPCSMNEIDGTPPFEIDQDTLSKLPPIPTQEMLKYKYPTEFKEKGFTKWERISQVHHSGAFVVAFPDVKWQQLIQSLSSTEALQWQAWIVGEFTISKDRTEISVTCTGINTYWIDDRGPISSDQYGNRPYSFYVTLDAGKHSIESLVRGKHQAQIKCSIEHNLELIISDKDTKLIEFIDQNRVPDIIDKRLASDIIGVTVQNKLSENFETIQILDIKANDENTFFQVENEDRPKLEPNQVLTIPVKIRAIDDFDYEDLCGEGEKAAFKLRVKYAYENDPIRKSSRSPPVQSADIKGEFRCRHSGSSFQFTFLDVDGSVQHAAAIHPIFDGTKGDKAPVLIALHGTGVSASSSADSYKYKKTSSARDYTFGIEGFWVLAPTRHGAHNWEGVGRNTAMAALNVLSAITKDSKIRADTENVIFAGHSMGGHGAWILAYNYPDKALAVIPQAGWTLKETYGDSNTLFLHDLQSSSIDNRLKSIIEASVQENSCEFHVPNLKHIPVLVRVGSADQVVHPWWSRRMVRLLKQIYTSEESNIIQYTEIPLKEHWWWDTKKENDGGVTNDTELRKFFKSLRNVESNQNKQYMEGSGDKNFELVVFNPSSVQSKHGFLILQQLISYQKSTLKVSRTLDEDIKVTYSINTVNVRRFLIKLSEVISSELRDDEAYFLSIHIDDNIFSYRYSVLYYAEYLEFYVEDKTKTWTQCHERNPLERYPSTYGPLRQVFESPFKIIYGTVGNGSSTKQYLDWAIYLANTWYMTGDARVEILSDEDFNETMDIGSNVLLIGDANTNKLTKSLTEKNKDVIDFQLHEDYVRVGPCKFSGNVGFVSLFPFKDDTESNDARLAAVIAGTTLRNMFDIVMLSKPTIPPMTRQPFSNTYPDFIVTGDETYQKGMGGFLAAGYWGYDWNFDERSSYVSYCKSAVDTPGDNNKIHSKHLTKTEL